MENFDDKEKNAIINNNLKNNEITAKYSIPINNDEQENEENSIEDNKKYSVKILGYNFVENNKYNCEIIYNNQKYDL